MGPRPLARYPRGPWLRILPGSGPTAPVVDDDESLVSAFQKGATGAGAKLYDRLYPIVDATLVRIIGGREQDHPDLVQSAFEQIVATLSRRTFARGCTLAGWASALTCHVGLNALRSRRRERKAIDRDRPLEADVHAERTAPCTDSQIDARYGLALVRRHLSEMDADRATALLLHAMGHDLAEIAALTKTSVAAAQSRLSRGRRELRARIEAAGVTMSGEGGSS